MKINIGDKVRFLNDVGGGIVVKFLKNNMVLVENEDGFEYPINSNEIIVVEKAKPPEPAQTNKVSDKVIEQKNELKVKLKKG